MVPFIKKWFTYLLEILLELIYFHNKNGESGILFVKGLYSFVRSDNIVEVTDEDK